MAILHALRKGHAHVFEWLERAWSTQPSNVGANLLFEPLLLRYEDNLRFNALCKKIALPPLGTALPIG